ncbi:MAG: cell wall biogenesis regulatory protein [candidate division TM6 bacterium GW2011_GWF2_37_49]|nr:MAG: cell wall biogenesis regulatory protein [candidate division TM6 bacterium GW2011_GWF2_37_49]
MNKQNVSFFSLARQVKNLDQKLKQTIDAVLQSQQFIGGDFVAEFETKMAEYTGAKHVISCNSGTDALQLALRALCLQKDAIVLTTPFSFIASSSEIAALGGQPVFIDIDPETFNICTKNLNNWLQKNAKIKDGKTIHTSTGRFIQGILAVDIFGQCADYSEIQKIANEWNLWIVEDVAQAVGAEINGKKSGNFGVVGCFSFYPTKNLGAYGDAGCCVTNDPILAEKITRIRNHGRKSHYNYEEAGINSRLDGIQAAILTLKLNYIDSWNTRRREIADKYCKGLAGIKFIKTPKTKIGTHVFHQYSIQIDGADRAFVEKYLADNGVPTRIFYPQTLDSISFLQTAKELKNECPIADKLVQTVLCLPIWPELEDQEIEYIIQVFKKLQTEL